MAAANPILRKRVHRARQALGSLERSRSIRRHEVSSLEEALPVAQKSQDSAAALFRSRGTPIPLGKDPLPDKNRGSHLPFRKEKLPLQCDSDIRGEGAFRDVFLAGHRSSLGSHPGGKRSSKEKSEPGTGK